MYFYMISAEIGLKGEDRLKCLIEAAPAQSPERRAALQPTGNRYYACVCRKLGPEGEPTCVTLISEVRAAESKLASVS